MEPSGGGGRNQHRSHGGGHSHCQRPGHPCPSHHLYPHSLSTLWDSSKGLIAKCLWSHSAAMGISSYKGQQQHTGLNPDWASSYKGQQQHTGLSPDWTSSYKGQQQHTGLNPDWASSYKGQQQHTGLDPDWASSYKGQQQHTGLDPDWASSYKGQHQHTGLAGLSLTCSWTSPTFDLSPR